MEAVDLPSEIQNASVSLFKERHSNGLGLGPHQIPHQIQTGSYVSAQEGNYLVAGGL